jgi:hypothetical protein
MLPTDLPPHQTVYHFCWTWRRAGVWERMHDTLRGDWREASGSPRAPRGGIIDSQTVITTEKGGSGAMMAASASVGASAPSWSMSWGCSWSLSSIRLGGRTAMGQTGLDGIGRPLPRTATDLGGWRIRGQARHVGCDGAATHPRHREMPTVYPRFSGRAMALDHGKKPPIMTLSRQRSRILLLA